jgi:hypothetical protein
MRFFTLGFFFMNQSTWVTDHWVKIFLHMIVNLQRYFCKYVLTLRGVTTPHYEA